MSKLIAVIEGESITEYNDGAVRYTAKAAIDTDGSGPLHGDPYAQRDTSLHWMGKPLNADVDKYVVVPPAIIRGVRGIVLGCQAMLTNNNNGKHTSAVVGDIGPREKLGEISVATAKALGINPSPTTGGTDEHIVDYIIIPGVPAVVDGKLYQLQPYHPDA